ncbi:MAG: family 78 glycoside hydrolase catalytic domain [Bacteroides sp.]|nr:family 78 glycoside hydrolase catalytic domain [Bacteroides sp.]
MNRYIFLFVWFALCHAAMAQARQTIRPTGLKVNGMELPIGVSSDRPFFSWRMEDTEQAYHQQAYQILVATSPEKLVKDEADVWNSGRKDGTTSACIVYAGATCQPCTRYFWKVRTFDKEGNASAWSASSFWETGNKNVWEARWIATDEQPILSSTEGVSWIWHPQQDAFDVPSRTTVCFSKSITLDEMPLVAIMQTCARGNYELWVNGHLVDAKTKDWQVFESQDIRRYLKLDTSNLIEVRVTTVRSASFHQATGKKLTGSYAAMAGRLTLEMSDGRIDTYPTSNGVWDSAVDGRGPKVKAVVVAGLDDARMGLHPGPMSLPAYLFRRNFDIPQKSIISARLYITAHGCYRAYINGGRVGNDWLTPGFTDYNFRTTYQTYDVTDMIGEGQNAIGVLLADGWYGSPLGWNGEHDLFQDHTNKLLAELHIRYADGSEDRIATDGGWKCARSGILKSEIYSGEIYDARLFPLGWNDKAFDESTMQSCVVCADVATRLVPVATPEVRVVEQLHPVGLKQLSERKWLADMGQNMAGIARLKVSMERGSSVTLRFAEVLDEDGNIYVENLRNASASDVYIASGKSQEEMGNLFSFHGFRYIEIEGDLPQLEAKDLTVDVLSSALHRTGSLQTSSSLINQMYSLGIWGQRSNFISVPTDCPQRDERLGYTGDGQVFWRTATFNFDSQSFARKWLDDIFDTQTEDGGVANTAPAVPKSNRKAGAPGWEDAAVIIPWTTWLQYGDTRLIDDYWERMEKYMRHVDKDSKDYIRNGGRLGDWLATDMNTPNPLISTALWGITCRMMEQMATATERTDKATYYRQKYDSIGLAFRTEFIHDGGKIGSGSQASYVMALASGFLTHDEAEQATDSLVAKIALADYHLSTGFLSTPYLLKVLAENGQADIAYRLLCNTTYPSWGYMVAKGATTWWERWNGDTGNPAMNSYNHYAFGAVAEWMYTYMAGIRADNTAPGFKRIVIAPVFSSLKQAEPVRQVRGEYLSPYGKIVSEWSLNDDGSIHLHIVTPPNTDAELRLPDGSSQQIPQGDYSTIIKTIKKGI